MRDDRYPLLHLSTSISSRRKVFSGLFSICAGLSVAGFTCNFRIRHSYKWNKACVDKLISIDLDTLPAFDISASTEISLQYAALLARFHKSCTRTPKRTYGMGAEWLFKSIGIFLQQQTSHGRPFYAKRHLFGAWLDKLDRIRIQTPF
jgi:hypothetical protein